jgi:hypothetical protein
LATEIVNVPEPKDEGVEGAVLASDLGLVLLFVESTREKERVG